MTYSGAQYIDFTRVFFYVQNAKCFYVTCIHVICLRKVQQSAPVLQKITAAQQAYVQIFFTEFHQDQTSDIESTGRNLFTIFTEV
jgi:hypothetical protein